ALCLVSGQNGVITAALMGGALLCLDRRPVLAGILFGVLTYKPHLAALAFPALILGGHWRTAVTATVTAILFVLASLAVLGTAPWQAFLNNLDFLARVLDTGAVPWVRMPTVYAAARVLGLEIAPARVLQAIATAAALVVVGIVWYRRAPLAWRGSALVLAFPLATPYAFAYDPVARVLPIAWLFLASLEDEASPVEHAMLVVAWFSPALFWVIARAGGPPLMPLVLAGLMALVWHRTASAAPSRE